MPKLDIGSGYSRKEGYTRLDADKNCNPDILAKAEKIPSKDNTYDEVYASHILEHYDPEDTFKVLREWYRVLKPEGKLIVKVPDIGSACEDVTDNSISWHEFKRILFGSDPKANEFMRHKNAFNDKYLERMLFITGYIKIKQLAKGYELVYEAYK